MGVFILTVANQTRVQWRYELLKLIHSTANFHQHTNYGCHLLLYLAVKL